RILAAATYIFCASAIPALAFGEQLYSETEGLLSAVQVLAATAITDVVQAVAGGQPLLIVGVAEPIVITYKFMYDFAKGREGLGRELFLAWSAWTCVWASLFVLVLALCNACAYISRFTRFAGELFGALIAMLFLQQAIKGSVEEFQHQEAVDGAVAEPQSASWQLANGLWSLLIAFGVLLFSLLVRGARSWRFLRPPLRALLADYGTVVVLVAFSGLSFAVRAPGGGDMGRLEGRWIAAAAIPAVLITILFFFDHNVSSQLAQQPEFGLRKPPAYHYDFFLLGLMTLLCGLLGLPPVNGVLPQAPMHTRALARCMAEGGPSDSVVAMHVLEQRLSGLLQSLGVGVCLATMPAIRQMPTAALWGYFAFMALESLPGSQLWDRTLLLLTDPARRPQLLERGHAPYLETVPFRQAELLSFLRTEAGRASWVQDAAWVGVGFILFPVPIMLLVPLRQYAMPRCFRHRRHLQELDAMHEEEAAPMSHEQAVQASKAVPLGPRQHVFC
ncbi:hypothetical protein CHLNCDRAFT_20008, partial [Chlorella variabilis]